MRAIIFWISLVIFFSLPSNLFATAPSIITYPSSINSDTNFTVTATMSGLSNNTIYRLRLAFAQPSTSNYFGSTYNGSAWYNGTPSPIDYTKFLTITTDGTGAWGGDIQGKVELADPNFTTGSGTYDFKIGRYTQSGTSATWSNVVPIAILAPTNTPTPTPSPTPSPTSSPTSTPKPTSVPGSTNTPVLPSPTPTKTPNKIVFGPSTPAATLAAAILGANSSFDTSENKTNPSKSRSSKEVKTLASSENILPKIFIGIGAALIAICGILLGWDYIKKHQESN